MSRLKLLTAAASMALLPSTAFACACGCAVFDVGTASLLPNGPGGTAFLEYDFLDQTTNWSGSGPSPSALNDDKQIRSDFFVAGGQYMFNGDWGVMAEVPYTDRYFRTTDPGNPGAFTHSALGDVRLMGVYSGFSSDMSSGVVFGVKLPTGDSTYANFDPDVEISSGSTDMILGAYHTGSFGADSDFGYYGQVMWQHELATQHGYTPGSELNAAFGASYNSLMAGGVGIAPILELLVSYRGRDGGVGDPNNTGYTRLLVAAGVKIDMNVWKAYADVEVAAYQDVNGNQLTAPAALKFILSRSI